MLKNSHLFMQLVESACQKCQGSSSTVDNTEV